MDASYVIEGSVLGRSYWIIRVSIGWDAPREVLEKCIPGLNRGGMPLSSRFLLLILEQLLDTDAVSS